MRLLSTLLLVGATACSTQDVVVWSDRARFTEYPNTLIEAFKTSCSSPAQTFSRPTRDVVECREFLPPEHTAALILGFDGTPEKLPQLVVQFRTTADAAGYLVEHDIFMDVPQKSGDSLQLRNDDPAQGRTLAEFYKRSGGVPE